MDILYLRNGKKHIEKNGFKQDCNNHRSISVTNTISKLYGSELIEEDYLEQQEKEQSGFWYYTHLPTIIHL